LTTQTLTSRKGRLVLWLCMRQQAHYQITDAVRRTAIDICGPNLPEAAATPHLLAVAHLAAVRAIR
jgi:hypothetical protein